MSFLVLETTGDFTVTAAVLAACVAHQPGGARDVRLLLLHLAAAPARRDHPLGRTMWAGCARMTVGKLMRRDPRTIPAALRPWPSFAAAIPLGSGATVVVLDAEERYAGIVPVADLFASELDADKETEGRRHRPAARRGAAAA